MKLSVNKLKKFLSQQSFYHLVMFDQKKIFEGIEDLGIEIKAIISEQEGDFWVLDFTSNIIFYEKEELIFLDIFWIFTGHKNISIFQSTDILTHDILDSNAYSYLKSLNHNKKIISGIYKSFDTEKVSLSYQNLNLFNIDITKSIFNNCVTYGLLLDYEIANNHVVMNVFKHLQLSETMLTQEIYRINFFNSKTGRKSITDSTKNNGNLINFESKSRFNIKNLLNDFCQIDTQPFGLEGEKIMNPLNNKQTHFISCFFKNHLLEKNNVFEETNQNMEISGKITDILNFLISLLRLIGDFLTINENAFDYKNFNLCQFVLSSQKSHICFNKNTLNTLLNENVIMIHNFKYTPEFCDIFFSLEMISVQEMFVFIKNNLKIKIIDIFFNAENQIIKIIGYK